MQNNCFFDSMKILLIGHTIIDHFASEREVVKPGGIFYNSLGFSSIMKPEDELYLITGFNEQDMSFYDINVDKGNFSYAVESDDLPEVKLIVHDKKEREEIYKNISGKLSVEKILDLNQFDGIFINMITGFDIDLDDLIKLRKSYGGLIYFDVHTLSRGLDENGNRNFRKIPNREKWLSNVDIVQVNQNELLTLSDRQDEFGIAHEVLSLGPKLLLVTKGNLGAIMFYMNNNRLESFSVPAEKAKVVNKIGCGDVFGAVFFYSYITNKNFFESLEKAVYAGSLIVTFKEFDDYSGLRNVFS